MQHGAPFDLSSFIPHRILKLINDPKRRQKEVSLKNYINSHPRSGNVDVKTLVKKLDESLLAQVRYFAHLTYTIMEQTQEWGDAGEQQVKIAFCRDLLELEADEPLNQTHAFRFSALVQENCEQLGFHQLSIDEAKKIFEEFVFVLFGQTYPIHDVVAVNSIMRFVGSKLFLQAGYYGHDREMILGKGKLKKMGEYEVVFLEKELARTPNTIMAMAAVIGDKQIFVRRTALLTIFHQKWVQFFEDEVYGFVDSNNNKYRDCSESIKKITLKKYRAKDKHTMLKKQDEFIEDMGETILLHEVGHGIIQHHVLDEELGAIGEATKVCGENICTGLLELLAEIAPKEGRLKGPLVNMANIAEKHPARATRMFYMYLSDTWFFDTEDDYMYLYSDLMSLFMVSHLNSKGVDFKRIRLALRQGPKEGPRTFLDLVLNCLSNISHTLWHMAQSAVYTNDEGEKRNFIIISMEISEEFEQSYREVPVDSYTYKTAYWTEVMEKLLNHSDKSDELKEILAKKEKEVLNVLFKRLCGEKVYEKFNGDSRAWVCSRLNEVLVKKD